MNRTVTAIAALAPLLAAAASDAAAAAEQFRSSAGAELRTVLPRSGAQVWQLEANRMATLNTLQANGLVRFYEAAPQASAPAMPFASAPMESLSSLDRATVSALTRKTSRRPTFA